MTTTETRMSNVPTSASHLAVNGGAKAIERLEGRPQPKIGVEEFFAIASRFGFKPDAMARLQAAVSDSDLEGKGPNLAKYATAYPAPPVGLEFERLGREVFGVPFALGTSSGTGALHAAMVAVGAAPGKEVIVPALGFMATAAAVMITGATPVFCDVDESLQLDPTKLEACITPRTVAVAPTHHWGMVADMDPIMAIAGKHGLKVIEDCAQSPGARYRGKCVGSIGDVGCFSISAYKIIGGGEGGMVVCKDQRLFDRINQLAECGGLWRPKRFDPPRYEGELFVGTNYRLSELESAINTVQMRKLPAIVGRMHTNYTRIVSQLMRVREIKPQKVNDVPGLIGYSLRFFPQSAELSVKITAALRAEGVSAGSRGNATGPDWHQASDMYPLHQTLDAASRYDQCKVAEDLYRREIRMGVDQWWTANDCDAVAAAMNKVFAVLCTPIAGRTGWL